MVAGAPPKLAANNARRDDQPRCRHEAHLLVRSHVYDREERGH